MGNMNSQMAAGNSGAQVPEDSADNVAAGGVSGPLRQNQVAQPNQAVTDQLMNSKLKKGEALAPGNGGKDQRLLIQNIM